jgi:segregation and condensation protein A
LTEYRVNLDIFAGPLDLLLYLVRKEEVDIYDIPISKITDQYIRHVDLLKQFDVDVAGDFLVMAATLMEIKSAMLLPKAELEGASADETGDPRSELIRQLLEYKRFKDAANLLDAAAERQQERFSRPSSIIDRLVPQAEPQIDMDQVSIWDLLEAFDAICKAIGTSTYDGHIKDDTPIDLYQIEVLHRLQTGGPLTFEQVFDLGSNRLVLVGIFLAMLELIRAKLIWAEQDDAQPRQIYLRALTDEPAEQVVQRAILAVGQTNGETPLDQTEQAQTPPPIPIVEVPAPSSSSAPEDDQMWDDTSLGLDEFNQPHPAAPTELPIPVVESPPKHKDGTTEEEPLKENVSFDASGTT